MSRDRVNVLLICTDQQRFDALGASGNAEIHTPHLDQLAADSAIFTNCYVQAPVHTTMVRQCDIKIIVHHGPPASARDRTGELYGLAADPGELISLWDDPDHAFLRRQMTELLVDVMVATEDRSQERKAFW